MCSRTCSNLSTKRFLEFDTFAHNIPHSLQIRHFSKETGHFSVLVDYAAYMSRGTHLINQSALNTRAAKRKCDRMTCSNMYFNGFRSNFNAQIFDYANSNLRKNRRFRLYENTCARKISLLEVAETAKFFEDENKVPTLIGCREIGRCSDWS